jgi:hypothetical protein
MSKTTAKKSNSVDDRMKRHEKALERLKISKQIQELRAKQKTLK